MSIDTTSTTPRVGITLPSLARSGPRTGFTLLGMVVATPPPAIPAQPTLTESDGVVTAIWLAVSGATSYKLWRSPPGTPVWTQVGPGVASLTAMDAPGVGTWQYAVSAVGVGGESAKSTPRSVTVAAPAPLPPSTPAQPTVSLASGVVTIDWVDALGALNYAVWRRPQGATPWTQIGFNVTQSVLTDSPGAGTWEYSVSAVNAAGESAKSTTSDPVTITSTPPTVNLVANVSEIDSTTVQVSWTPAVPVEVAILEPGQTSFTVLYTGTGNTIATGEQAIYVGELTPGGSYSFRVTDI
jgi:hypothetical protein